MNPPVPFGRAASTRRPPSLVPLRLRRAFTLVELLVLAVILLLLGVLLLAALPRAREEQALTRCRDNLRSIGLACNMYTGDQRFIPPAWAGPRSEFHGWTLSDVDADNKPVWQGIGRLISGGYISPRRDVISCPATSLPRFVRSSAAYAPLFSFDDNEPFLTAKGLYRRTEDLSDGDAIMDLAGPWGVSRGVNVIVSSYWLRVLDAPGGTLDHNAAHRTCGQPFALASDTILGWTPLPGVPDAAHEPTFISNHEGAWNVLSSYGSVKTYHDVDAVLRKRLEQISHAQDPNDRTAVGRSQRIFKEFFQPLCGN